MERRIPYMTEQFKRFGEYVPDLSRRPANLQITRDKILFEIQNKIEEGVV